MRSPDEDGPRRGRGIVFLGDLAQVTATLEIIDPRTVLAASRLLRGGRDASPRTPFGDLDAGTAGTPGTPGPPDSPEPDAPTAIPPTVAAPSDADARRPRVIPPEWLRPDPAVTQALVDAGRSSFRPATPDPLFRPRAARAILSSVLSVTVPEDEVDADAVVDQLCDGWPVGGGRADELPRRYTTTTRLGAQVLVDVGPALSPYLYDVRRLPDAVEAVIGPCVAVLRFAACPTLGAGGYRRPWPAYRPPPAGTPILVVSDLGAVAARLPDRDRGVDLTGEWLGFSETARSAGCPVVALTPAEPEQIDPRIREAIPVVSWDSTTTARHVLVALNRRR